VKHAINPSRLVALLAFALAPCVAQAQGSHALLKADLSLQQVSVLAFSRDSVRVVTETGAEQDLAHSDVLALWRLDHSPLDEGDTASNGASLELIDGRRWRGVVGLAEAEMLAWEHPLFGTQKISLERVSTYRRAPETGAPAAQGLIDDVVVLANGDEVKGFVEQLGLEVVIDTGVDRVTLPIASVDAVVLANELQSLTGPTVWLADGSVLSDVSILGDASGVLDIELDKGSGSVASAPAGDLLAFVPEAGRIVPLADVEMIAQQNAPGRRWSEPATFDDPAEQPLGASPLRIPGPMSVSWRLPPDAAGFVAEAVLPRDMRVWGDCELSLWVGDGEAPIELTRHRLHADDPSASLRAGLAGYGGQTLELRLDAGAFGPVQDRVVVSRPMLILQPMQP